jgi:hypothetical protein
MNRRYFVFVAFVFLLSICAGDETSFAQVDDAPLPFVVGALPNSIPESSGLVASRKHPGVFWTHNDSGNPPQIFAIDDKGKLLATYALNVANVDWEDIATDDAGHLYISETGNNARKRDRRVAVYRVDEPDPAKPVPSDPLKVNARYVLKYTAEPFDCEALFIWKDAGYVISKSRDGGQAKLYRFQLKDNGLPLPIEQAATLPLRAPVTAADMSPDGKELLVLTVFGPNRFVVNGDPTSVEKLVPRTVLFLQPDMEAATIAPGGILATTESGHVLFFPDAAFNDPKFRPTTPTTKVSIAPMKVAPTIDGDLSDWDATITSLPLKSDPKNEPTKATLLTSWTPAGLYIGATVPRADPSPLATEWFAGDVVEIFVGGNADGRSPEYTPSDERCYVGFEKMQDGKRGDAVLKWPKHPLPLDGASAAGKINSSAGTYTLEAFLPATAFGSHAPLKDDGTLRFNVSILAKTPKRNWYLSESNNAGSWISPLKWAVAELRSRVK